MDKLETIQIVATDTSVLINLIHVNRLGMLSAMQAYEFFVPAVVIAEVEDPAQAEVLLLAIDAGLVHTVEDVTTGELEVYSTLTDNFGDGESMCLALAESRSWYLASAAPYP